jgi:type IV pilus assembly protein PilM
MLEFLKLKQKAFGLDISDRSLKIIKLKESKKSFSLVSYKEMDIKPGVIEKGVIQDEDVLAKTISAACNSVTGEKLKTKYVIASLPEEKSFLQIIQMPKMAEKELRSAILFEAENYIPLPITEVYLDFKTIVPLKENVSHLDVLIVAMPKKIVNSYVASLKKAGLIPLALEIESQAIARALIKNELSESPVILVDFGKNSTDFIIFSGRSIYFTSSIPVSSDQLTSAIAETLGTELEKAEKIKMKYDIMDPESDARSKKIGEAMHPILEELVLGIRKYVNFYYDHPSHEHLASRENIQKIILCGGGSILKGFPEFLSKKIGVPVELGDFWINFPIQKSKGSMNANPLSYVTALGLALRQIKHNKDIA